MKPLAALLFLLIGGVTIAKDTLDQPVYLHLQALSNKARKKLFIELPIKLQFHAELQEYQNQSMNG